MPTHQQLARIVDRHLFNPRGMPGYCTTPGCNFSTFVAVEETRGWCECCHAKTVSSARLARRLLRRRKAKAWQRLNSGSRPEKLKRLLIPLPP